MGWFATLLGRGAPEKRSEVQEARTASKRQAGAPLQVPTLRFLVAKTLYDLVPKNPPGRPQQWMGEFIHRLDRDFVDQICEYVLIKMAQSLDDGKRHSTAISRGDVYINISTFPTGIDVARTSFFPNGYLKDLDALYAARVDFNGKDSHFLHLMFFSEGSEILVLLTFAPNRDRIDFAPTLVVPTQLLNAEERARLNV
jgi:hypothetical protein